MAQSMFVLANENPFYALKVAGGNGLSQGGELVRKAPGIIYGWHVANLGATPVLVRLYDQVTVPTDTDRPRVTLVIFPGKVDSAEHPIGIGCVVGIAWRATVRDDAGNESEPADGQVVANLYYA